MPEHPLPLQLGSSWTSTRPSLSSSIAPTDAGAALVTFVQNGPPAGAGSVLWMPALGKCTGTGVVRTEYGGKTLREFWPAAGTTKLAAIRKQSAVTKLV